MKMLVIGCGSIGKKHIKNLKELGIEVCAFDTNINRLKDVKNDYQVKTYQKLKDALKEGFDAALVCAPNHLHVPIAIDVLNSGKHVFIEKPISHTLERVDELINTAKKKRRLIMIGCNLRFHPVIQKVKEMLDKKEVGRVVSARAQFGQYLPDWHPWEDYRKGYSANKSMGGGIILDAIHEIDYIHWFFGTPLSVLCFAGKFSNLEIDTEDLAEILVKFKDKIVEIHLDYIQRYYTRNCRIIGEEGTIVADLKENKINLFKTESKNWQTFDFKIDYNRPYVDEMRHFISCIREGKRPAINGEEGRDALKIALAAKESSKTRREVSL